MRISDWSSDVCSSDLLLGEKSIPRSRPRLRIHPRIGPAAFALTTLVLYVATFETLGAFTLMPLFCAAVSRAFVKRPLLSLLLSGVAVTAFTWVLFVLLLGVPLPGSRLPFLLITEERRFGKACV